MMKKKTIKAIQKIVGEFGSFSPEQVGASYPILKAVGRNKNQVAIEIQFDGVLATVFSKTKDGFLDTEDEFVSYHDLDIDVLNEILFITEQYEANELQTLKRIS